MKVKEVIEKLKDFNQDAEFLVSCDEELNTLYTNYGIEEYSDDGKSVVIFGFSGFELEEEMWCSMTSDWKFDIYETRT